MNKICTSIEQSKKLAEILPLESADMGWYYSRNPQAARNQMWAGTKAENADISAWSLTALLGLIPHNVSFNKAVYRFKMVKYSDHWECYHENFGSVSTKIFKADNPVDACVEMILKLHELNLL